MCPDRSNEGVYWIIKAHGNWLFSPKESALAGSEEVIKGWFVTTPSQYLVKYGNGV